MASFMPTSHMNMNKGQRLEKKSQYKSTARDMDKCQEVLGVIFNSPDLPEFTYEECESTECLHLDLICINS